MVPSCAKRNTLKTKQNKQTNKTDTTYHISISRFITRWIYFRYIFTVAWSNGYRLSKTLAFVKLYFISEVHEQKMQTKVICVHNCFPQYGGGGLQDPLPLRLLYDVFESINSHLNDLQKAKRFPKRFNQWGLFVTQAAALIFEGSQINHRSKQSEKRFFRVTF